MAFLFSLPPPVQEFLHATFDIATRLWIVGKKEGNAKFINFYDLATKNVEIKSGKRCLPGYTGVTDQSEM